MGDRQISREEYDVDLAAVERNAFEPVMRAVRFDLRAFERDMDGCNGTLSGMLGEI